MDQDKQKHYLADNPPSIVPLAIKPHFEALSPREKLYAHYISVASYSGQRTLLRQVSPESEAIYDLIIELHRSCKGDWSKLQQQSGVSDEELKEFLSYAAQFLGNGGNFKGFGDSKFIPRISERQFKALSTVNKKALGLFEQAQKGIYAASTTEAMHLGFPDAGHVSSYYPESPGITKEEIKIVSELLDSQKLLPENTRLRKLSSGDFEVLIASAQKDPSKSDRDVSNSTFDLPSGSPLAGKKVKLVYGDSSVEMGKVADALRSAGKNAANETQKRMMDHYVKSFDTGSLEAFKDSQREWVKDKGPMVESDIGFIETYRDPYGTRGEWEGFAAMVNKERTKAFEKLVQAAPHTIPKLPWGKEFEKDRFLSPDFTSLEVLTFAGSGIPAGINIPNYDDIRQNLGFKNVSLGNVLSAKAPNEKIPFIREEDLEVYRKYRDPAFEVQVGLHELLGHGCGKLLQETSPGVFNFDKDHPPVSPITKKPIEHWYKPDQTYSSVFGALSSSYEECRAEAVALSLSCEWDILHLFGFGDGSANPSHDSPAYDVLYSSYLSMARAGVAALEFWDPQSRKWGQAHMQARFSLLRTFLEAGDDFCTIECTPSTTTDDEAKHDIFVHLDKSKIISHGRPAVDTYLQKLNVYRSTADIDAARTMYEMLTHVGPWWADTVRPAVIAKKQPRKVFVMANTFIAGKKDGEDQVELKEYEPTPEGMVQSWAEREYI